MKQIAALMLALMFFGGILAFVVWWDTYKYADCRKVGHSKLYCSLDIGK